MAFLRFPRGDSFPRRPSPAFPPSFSSLRLLLTFSVLLLAFAPNFADEVPQKNEPLPLEMSKQNEVPQLRAKRENVHGQNGLSIQALVELLLCFFLPPAAVAIHGGPSFKLHILLNVLLCILGWIPGILHAVWYCFISSN